MENIFVGVGGFEATEKMKENILDVLESGRLSYGHYLSKFEQQFAELHQCSYGITSNSGTSSLQVALQTLKILHNWQDGDEVIVPATTFVATVNIILHNRMTPVFVDVEADYYGINTDLIEEKISSKTRCIIPVHLFGMPSNMTRIMEISKKFQLKVIEDSAECMFASLNNQMVGSFGDISCFSTYVAHILTTGVGGISLTSNSDYAITIRSLVNHGRDPIYSNIDDSKGKTKEQMKEVINRRFKFVYPGHSFRTSEMEGAIGLAQLENWEDNIYKRQQNALFLTDQLSLFVEELQLAVLRPGATHSFMMYPIVTKNSSKQRICEFLESLGIETRSMLPIVNQPIYKEYFPDAKRNYPVSHNLVERGFYIGCHSYLTEFMLDHVVKVFKKYYDREIPPFSHRKTFAAVLITSPDKETTKNVVSQISHEGINNFYLADFYNSFPEQHQIEGVPITNITASNQREIYQYVADTITEDYVIFLLMDGSQSPSEFSAMIAHAQLGKDLVIATRFVSGGKYQEKVVFLNLRGVGNRIVTLFFNLMTNSNLTDSYQPFQCVSLDLMRSISFQSKKLSHYEITIQAAIKKRFISEIPTHEIGGSKSIGLLRMTWNGFKAIFLVFKHRI